MLANAATRRVIQRSFTTVARSFLTPSASQRSAAVAKLGAAIPRNQFAPSVSSLTPIPSTRCTRRFFSEEAKKETTTSAATDDAADTAADAEQEEATPPPSEEEQMKAQIAELKDQLLRSLAEQENIRTIAKRDIQSARDFAIKKFAKSLLDVPDNLTRALDAVPKDEQQSEVFMQLVEGIKMTEAGLTKAFGQNGLTKFCEEPGDVFDPTKHEALYEYPDPEKEPGTVGQIMKVGYLLNDRVLRPAEVGVVKKAA